jgi:phosphohistidine phosphatase
MRLLIVRHASAVPRGTPGIPDDERPLTPEGEERFREAAAGLARLVDRPDTILTSPLPRARRTAEIAAEAWGRVAPAPLPALADGELSALTARLSACPEDSTVAIFGHEPHVSELLARLLGTDEDDRLAFKKGGAALVDLPGKLEEGGRLLWFLPPKLLRRLAD